MKIVQEFVIRSDPKTIWAFFHDIPQVADCLPGADYLGDDETGRRKGRVSSKVGPFHASFEGDAGIVFDESNKIVSFEGKGVDRKGASRGKLTMVCTVMPHGDSTKIAVDADVQLSGAVAQFGRTGILAEIANTLVADFVRNVEAKLEQPATSAAGSTSRQQGKSVQSIGILSLLARSLAVWFRGLLGRKT